MNIAGIQNAMVGFTLFDSWLAGMKKMDAVLNPPASPLVDAAFKAFDVYLGTQEAQHNALISRRRRSTLHLRPQSPRHRRRHHQTNGPPPRPQPPRLTPLNYLTT